MVPDISSRRSRALLVNALIFVSVSVSAASGQSFDCAKATSAVEKMICSDTELKALDTRMAQLYAQALKAVPVAEQPGLRSEQRDWIKTRDACATAAEPRRNCVSVRLYAAQQPARWPTDECTGDNGGVRRGWRRVGRAAESDARPGAGDIQGDRRRPR